jgi:cell division protein FtsN
MLRLLVLALLLANAVFFAWSQGLLAAWGWAPANRTEPQRLAQQIHPERLRLLGKDELAAGAAASTATASASASASTTPASGAAAASAASAAGSAPAAVASAPAPTPSAPTVSPTLAALGPASTAAGPRLCLQAGLFDEPQAANLRRALEQAGLAQGSWQLDSGIEPARWIIYMGPYANADAVTRKQSELRYLAIRYEALRNSAMAPGLSLGAYGSQAEANAALAQLASRGVRTARVVMESPERRGHWLRLPAADNALRQSVEGLKAALVGRPLQPCR